MILNGLGPQMPLPEKRVSTDVEAEQIKKAERLQAALQEEAKKEAARKEAADSYEMNDFDLKQLLFLVSSRGNTETVEKLAQILKKQKEESGSKNR